MSASRAIILDTRDMLFNTENTQRIKTSSTWTYVQTNLDVEFAYASELNKGSRFALNMPLSLACELDASESAEPLPQLAGSSMALNGRALLVEDNTVNRIFVRKVLEKAGLTSRRTEWREHLIEIQMEPLRNVDRWFDDLRSIWALRLDALDDLLKQETAE